MCDQLVLRAQHNGTQLVLLLSDLVELHRTNLRTDKTHLILDALWSFSERLLGGKSKTRSKHRIEIDPNRHTICFRNHRLLCLTACKKQNVVSERCPIWTPSKWKCFFHLDRKAQCPTPSKRCARAQRLMAPKLFASVCQSLPSDCSTWKLYPAKTFQMEHGQVFGVQKVEVLATPEPAVAICKINKNNCSPVEVCVPIQCVLEFIQMFFLLNVAACICLNSAQPKWRLEKSLWYLLSIKNNLRAIDRGGVLGRKTSCINAASNSCGPISRKLDTWIFTELVTFDHHPNRKQHWDHYPKKGLKPAARKKWKVFESTINQIWNLEPA